MITDQEIDALVRDIKTKQREKITRVKNQWKNDDVYRKVRAKKLKPEFVFK